MEKLLSIIVPVYNVEPYLEECLNSILPQCDDTCEIILVDDGSTDGSSQLCDHLAKDNPAVIAIHQQNQGPGIARNTGMQCASGKYVTFLDSDDRLAGASFPVLLQYLTHNTFDLAFMQISVFFADGQKRDLGDCIYRDQISGKSKDEIMSYLSTRPKFPGSPCSKIYLRSFLEDNHLRFPTDRRVAEDLGFVLDCIRLAEKYDAFDFPWYEYRQGRADSVSHSAAEKRVNGLLLFVSESTAKLTINKKASDFTASCAMSFVAYEYAIILMILAGCDSNTKRALLPSVQEYKWTLKYAGSRKIKIIRLIMFCLGVRLSSAIVALIKKAK